MVWSNTVHFNLNIFQCFEHAECIAIDIFDVLGNELPNALGPVSLNGVKKKHIFLNKLTYSRS